ncbi:aldo/keto reductase [Paenibacillus sp. V4I5]|uniref:aldo/keto reductase n=1 Tax=Paenibacillus sp. V4I5 TaxID=3042306 RepID=UPI002793ABF3|nr:aldo/keto reductase [Paenibacillus sp. V4I5]MDQ0917071.1 aryl-alcohol dehydrogenase-like predicted oxidoreductase [Paenibacillus sp. V4I5]
MKYRKLGNSGVLVSELCLGTMLFGSSTDAEESARMVHRFLDAGGNFIDTADIYTEGVSEEIVGKAIGERRSEVILATKAGISVGPHPNDRGNSRKHIMDGVDASLRRLNTDYIDLFYLHVWDDLTPIEETLRALDDLVSSGKVRYIGCCNFLAWQLMKSLAYSDAKDYARFVAIQQQYSLVSRDADREHMSLCLEENVGIIPWGPLGGGLLTGKYNNMEKPDFGRFSLGLKGEFDYNNKFTPKNFEIVNAVKEMVQQTEKTSSQVALNWLLGKKGITSPIIGASSIAQFEDNMGAVGWSLTTEQWEQLDSVSSLPSEYPARMQERFRRTL